MMKLKDGRDELWQWDTGREISIDAECSQVHFGRGVYGRTIDVDVVDGSAKIPDILLQSADELHCYGYVGSDADGYTKIEKVFKVNKRKKPADYVFTEQDQRTLEQIIERVAILEEMQDPEAIKNAVEDYLKNNPIEFELQPATADSLGGVKAVPATDAMTEYVGIDADGKLKVPLANAGGGSGSTWRKIRTITLEQTTQTILVSTDENGNPFELDDVYIRAKAIHNFDKGANYHFGVAFKGVGDYYNAISAFGEGGAQLTTNFFCVGGLAWYTSTSVNSVSEIAKTTIGEITPSKITEICMKSMLNSVHFIAGSTFEIWGR